MKDIRFEDTQEALTRLLEMISVKNPPLSNAILVAISMEGVEMAHQMAQHLKIPMDFLFTETITAPLNPECAIAVVSEDMEIVANESLIAAFSINLDYVYGEAQRKYEEEISQSRYKFRKGEMFASLKGKDVILMELGIQTGLRANVAVKTCMNMGAKSVSIASPVMPKMIYDSLSGICDDVYCISVLDYYVSTAHYFPQLQPLEDEQIEEILNHYITHKGQTHATN